MKTVSKALFVLALLIGGSICAMAGSIEWTFNDVVFNNGNTVTGFFITDSAITMYEGFNVVVGGGDPNGAFTATQMVNSYLPSLIGAANGDFSKYIALFLDSPMTSAGGTIPIDLGFDCPGTNGCGTLLTGDGYDPEIIGIPVSEPSVLLVLGSSLGILGTLLRRAIARA
jgi:hypothetical protein